jgi:chromate transporter
VTTPTGEIALLFLRLGATAFGGPAAHIAMMEDEVVRRRGWMTREQFLDFVGATSLMPGPNSTELAIHIGHARGGWRGLLVAGLCFILPAALVVGLLAAAYVRFGELPVADGILYGVKPVVIAIVVQALWRLGRTAVKSIALAAGGVVAAAAVALGIHELVVLLAAAVVGMAARTATRGGATARVVAAPIGLIPLFGIFLKMGSVLFGSGYVLLAFLRADLVERLGWITERQLLDAVAVGQATPGPVFTTATFIGYLVGGPAGAAVATAGIFLPAFVFVALSGPLIPRIRASPVAAAALDAVNVASLALMAVVTLHLTRSAIVDIPSAVLAAASLVLVLRTRVNVAWVVIGGAAAGILIHRASTAVTILP